MRTATGLLLSLFLVLLSLSSPAAAQSQPSSAAALAGASLAAKAVAALDGSVSLTSIRLTGTVTRAMGAAETGTVVLEAEPSLSGGGAGASRVEFDLPSGTRIELRGTDAYGGPWGAWIEQTPEAQGQAHAMALHNCWTPAVWFLPRLSVLRTTRAGDRLVEVAEPAGGPPDLRKTRTPANQSQRMTAEIERLSTADLFLDPATGLPQSLRYNLHPDKNANRDIPVEIRFSDFQRVQGVEIPFHIQRYMQVALDYDIRITEAEVNPALDQSDFTEPSAVVAQYAAPLDATAGQTDGR